MREHDVAALSAAELEAAHRTLAASLALGRPGSPTRVPIQDPHGRDRRRTRRADSSPARLTRPPSARFPDGGHAG